MKTKFYHYVILSAALAFSAPKANAQTLIQFWDFNQTSPSGGGGGDSLGNVTNPLKANQVAAGLDTGHIIYSRPQKEYGSGGLDGILDNGSQGSGVDDFTNSNDTGGTAAGNLFVRTRNPSDSSALYLYIPTTGYKNITLDYVLSASSSKGPNYNIFSYSTNGGSSWNNLTKAMDTFNIGGVYRPDTMSAINPTTSGSNWYPVHIDFSSDANVNNNSNFVLRLMLAGPNSVLTSGNDRYDNFAVKGTSNTGAGVGAIAAQSAGYNVYPNPTNSVVNVISSQYSGNKLITIYNVVGQVVSVTENKDLQTSINTSSLNAGVYFVEIKEVSTGNKYTVKLVKE
jgi:Secretion system C-terminal sorting domain